MGLDISLGCVELSREVVISQLIDEDYFFIDQEFIDYLNTGEHDRFGLFLDMHEAAYWRKKWGILGYFEKNLPNGVENGGPYYISKEIIDRLKVLCDSELNTISSNKLSNSLFELADFKDSTLDLSQEDLKETSKMIGEIQSKHKENMIYFYDSSW